MVSAFLRAEWRNTDRQILQPHLMPNTIKYLVCLRVFWTYLTDCEPKQQGRPNPHYGYVGHMFETLEE